MQATPLSNKHIHTVENIFRHPASHNLEWRDVIALVEHLGSVHEENDGRMKFTLNGVSQTFQRSKDKKDVSEVEQIVDLRRFLEGAGVEKDGTMAASFSAGSSSPEALLDAQTPTNDNGPEQHEHEAGHLNTERSHHAEQQLKTQQHEQNDREVFPKGLAQEHGKGRG